MAQPLTSSSIEALIEGGVSGQVAVGNQNVQIHADHGAVVFMTPPGTQPALKLRSLPVFQRPRQVRGLLDRQAEVSSALAAIGTALPVGIHGAPGIGKSTLLRHLAYAVESGALPDGVIHLSARQQPAEDLLQSLFDAFYTCDVPYKPTAVQARQLLQSRKALVLLDDAELDREAAERLLDSTPDCAFVLATRERCLWGECQSIGLGGLPLEDARALFERELGRSLTAEEASAFESLYARLEGHPLRLLQAVAQVREGRPVADPKLIAEGSLRQTLATLPEDQKRLLSALAAMGGGPVGAAHLAALADVANPIPALDALWDRALIQAHSPRYSLAENLPDLLPRTWDLSHWRERALGYFIAWAEARKNEPAALLEEEGVLRHLLDWAAETGRHAEARRLGRALDAALAVAGRWGAWERTLERIRGAAEALGDRATQGWALHQLGTRLLCLDDKAAARPLLNEALAIREALGDRAGAAVTRHNLGLLGPLPPSEPSGAKEPRSALRLLPWIGGALLVLVVVAIGLLRFWPGKDDRKDDTDGPVISDTPLATTDLSETTDFDVPQRLEFPTMEFGSQTGSRVKTISVTNTGTIPLRVAGVSFTENSNQAFTLKSACMQDLLPAGSSCSIQISFEPPKDGAFGAVLAIDVEGLERRLVEISGEASEPPICLTLSPPQGLNFRELPVGESRRLRATISNCGNAPLRISFLVRGDDAEEFAVYDPCSGKPLKGGETCDVYVIFTPTSPGKRDLRLTVTGRTADVERSLPLRGTALEVPPPLGWCCIDGKISEVSEADCKDGGTFFKDRASIVCPPLQPKMELSPRNGLDFGEVELGQSQSPSVTIRNTGNAPLTIDTISLSERTREFAIDKRCIGEVLPPKKTCVFPVTFKPAVPGRRELQLTVTDRTAGIEETLPVLWTALRVLGWCCAGGKVVKGTKAECTEGRFFERESLALLACAVEKKGCCLNGTFERDMAEDECVQREGVVMKALEAPLRCRKPRETPPPPEKGFCCIRGTIADNMTEENCVKRGGNFSKTKKEADEGCPVPIR